ncbi:hypothetical protein ACROYT_G029279 [Oculina patagonica]
MARLLACSTGYVCPGLSADLQQMDDSRKTAIINKELTRLNIDVACLQETWLADSGSLRESDFTFETVGAVLPPWPLHHQQLLQVQGTAQSVLETSPVPPLAARPRSPGERISAASFTREATTAQTVTLQFLVFFSSSKLGYKTTLSKKVNFNIVQYCHKA